MYFVEKQKIQFHNLGKTKRVHPQPTGSTIYMYFYKVFGFSNTQPTALEESTLTVTPRDAVIIAM
jgi:hypothetical protein